MKDTFRSQMLSGQDHFADTIKAKQAAYLPHPKVGPDVAKEEGGSAALQNLLRLIKGKAK